MKWFGGVQKVEETTQAKYIAAELGILNKHGFNQSVVHNNAHLHSLLNKICSETFLNT